MPKRSSLIEPDFFVRSYNICPPFKWHSKSGQKSGFQMVGTSLDRFIKKRGMNKIFFMPKRSRLILGLFFPGFGRFGYRMVGTGPKSTFKSRNGPAFGCIL